MEFTNEHGGIRIGAASLGEILQRTKQRVLQIEAEACATGFLQRIRHGGGKHRTNWFVFKLGEWRDKANDPKAQRHFADRAKAAYTTFAAAELAMFAEHIARGLECCLRFGPRDLKHPPPDEPIEWMSAAT